MLSGGNSEHVLGGGGKLSPDLPHFRKIYDEIPLFFRNFKYSPDYILMKSVSDKYDCGAHICGHFQYDR